MIVVLPGALLVLQVVLNVPQLVRLWRRQNAGVSFTGELLSALSGVGWLAFAALTRDVALIGSAVLGIVGYGPASWMLVRAGRPWRAGVFLGAAIAVTTAAALAGWGVHGLATILELMLLVQYGAYLRTALGAREWTGFSPTSSLLRITFGVGWTVYGAATHSSTVTVWGVLTAVTFAATFTLWWIRAGRPARILRRQAATGAVAAVTLQP